MLVSKFSQTSRKNVTKLVSYLLIVVFAFHAVSFHAFAKSLVLCFEEDGQVVLESETGSFLSIPTESQVHSKESKDDFFDKVVGEHYESHLDLSVASICKKEQRVTRSDQQDILAHLSNISISLFDELPLQKIFQARSYTPLKIENYITTSLQTIVLLN